MGEVYIVSRHEGTISYLKRHVAPEAKVINHLSDPEQIPAGSMVFGNLPINLIE